MPEGRFFQASFFIYFACEKEKNFDSWLHVFIQLMLNVFIVFNGQELIIYLHQITRLIIQIVRIW